MAARMPSRWRRSVRASRTNGVSREREAQASQASRCAGASARVGRGGRAAGALRAAGRRGRAAGWPAGPRRACASWRTVWCSGALSSDQRVPLTQRPFGVCERSWAFHSSRRTWSIARAGRAGRRGTGQSRSRRRGRRRGSRAGTRRSCRSRPPGSSAWRSPSSSKKRLQGGAVAARRAPHDRARRVVGDAWSGSGDGGGS